MYDIILKLYLLNHYMYNFLYYFVIINYKYIQLYNIDYIYHK